MTGSWKTSCLPFGEAWSAAIGNWLCLTKMLRLSFHLPLDCKPLTPDPHSTRSSFEGSLGSKEDPETPQANQKGFPGWLRIEPSSPAPSSPPRPNKLSSCSGWSPSYPLQEPSNQGLPDYRQVLVDLKKKKNATRPRAASEILVRSGGAVLHLAAIGAPDRSSGANERHMAGSGFFSRLSRWFSFKTIRWGILKKSKPIVGILTYISATREGIQWKLGHVTRKASEASTMSLVVPQED